MPVAVEFWFDFASTYSYVAAMRVEEEAGRRGLTVSWHPFLLGPIFTERLGLRDSPFNAQPIRGRYMWRDLERLCLRYKLPWKQPSVFPRSSTLAARLATVAVDQPWGSQLVRRIFTANFAEDRDIADRAVLSELLRELGQEPGPLFARAEAGEARARLRDQTGEAMSRDVFGAPNFFVAGELFFGQDRLTEALDAAAT